eukprot:TRINITY_DN4656_c0_g1_i1.p1 TRINITY_DN4656_c0_g1~~TRINITY_DN4656_c0_g1_i1.p1  ORF type:complete len:266 (+),score=43.73 TRINITY_DN4656_c0_g1_i1:49-846(+)
MTHPGNLRINSRPFNQGKFLSLFAGGWGIKDWLFPSVFIGKGGGPDFDAVVRNTLKSSSAITKVNFFDSHFAAYSEYFCENFPGFFDSRYRFEVGAKTIMESKYPIKDFPVVDQRSWRSPRLQDLWEVPHPEHTFACSGPVVLNTEANRAEHAEQLWHGKDPTWVDVRPLHVCPESHTEALTVGDGKLCNGVWVGKRNGWKRNSAKPELTAPFHSPVWYRNVFVVKNSEQHTDNWGDNVCAETHQECTQEYTQFTQKFHAGLSWW